VKDSTSGPIVSSPRFDRALPPPSHFLSVGSMLSSAKCPSSRLASFAGGASFMPNVFPSVILHVECPSTLSIHLHAERPSTPSILLCAERHSSRRASVYTMCPSTPCVRLHRASCFVLSIILHTESPSSGRTSFLH
jgi:hypothetical protein